MQPLFKSPSGKIIIAQKPNAPLIIWFVFLLAEKLPVSVELAEVFGLLSYSAIFAWAWLEITEGVNLFRRILGATIMIYGIMSRLTV